MQKKIQCPFCFERFAIEIFLEDGGEQEMVYDCEVCCHPIDIKVSLDPETQKAQVSVEKSSGF